MGQLDDQVALVTGAGGGIGRLACARLLAEGACVAALDRNIEAAKAAIATTPERGMALACDVGDGEAMAQAVMRVARHFGKLTVLCGIAGGSSPADAPVTETTDEEFWRCMRVDLFGTFAMCRHGIPHLVASGGGSVITMSSITAVQGIPRLACYSAAKGGVITLTRSMAVDYAAKKVRVNAIAPGITLTDRIRRGMETGRVTPELSARHLLGIVPPSDVAEVVVFLAGPGSASITGQVIPVDGGASVT